LVTFETFDCFLFLGIEESHKYGPVNERVRGELATAGPVYPVDPSNKYNIVPERKSGQIVMAGPAYSGDLKDL